MMKRRRSALKNDCLYSDTQIRETIRERHCRTVIELHNLLGVCINCCKCRETIEGILDDERQIGLTQVWVHNYRGQYVYKTVMSIVPRKGDLISDGPGELIVTRVRWFELTERHDWVAEVYTCKADYD